MPTSPEFRFPRRYNSLRLLGFDYASPTALYFLTVDTDGGRPLCGDIKLAKAVLAALLHDKTQERIRLIAYTLMPDHLHLLAGVRQAGKTLSSALGAFKSFTTQLFWKRSREIVQEQRIALPPSSVQKSSWRDASLLLAALNEWRVVLRPEVIEMKNWPRVHPDQFLGKQLWHTKFNDHVIRNEADLRETITYIAMNPVKRGYVSQPQYYPFTGFGVDLNDVGRRAKGLNIFTSGRTSPGKSS